MYWLSGTWAPRKSFLFWGCRAFPFWHVWRVVLCLLLVVLGSWQNGSGMGTNFLTPKLANLHLTGGNFSSALLWSYITTIVLRLRFFNHIIRSRKRLPWLSPRTCRSSISVTKWLEGINLKTLNAQWIFYSQSRDETDFTHRSQV